jgi:hypothetical protein
MRLAKASRLATFVAYFQTEADAGGLQSSKAEAGLDGE